ncbi:Destabilase [Popillia japonica]|uniref:lysozyme n=1 Tax=Popillia japonica TaxID=7064 RepID=A0AAW1HHP6_POPJA
MFCSTRTVQGYMRKFKKDCNNDGEINCDDYFAIHFLGGYGCTAIADHLGYHKRIGSMEKIPNPKRLIKIVQGLCSVRPGQFKFSKFRIVIVMDKIDCDAIHLLGGYGCNNFQIGESSYSRVKEY